MEQTEVTQIQANRVADVSDTLDGMDPATAKKIWTAARRRYFDGNVSFLQAFEASINASGYTDRVLGQGFQPYK
jgi:hypothetical protein